MKQSIYDDLIHHIKQHYAMLYSWHLEVGKQLFRKKVLKRDTESFSMDTYYKLLNSLVSPQNASLEFIAKVAKEQVSGVMEWSYNEKIHGELPLHAIAHQILQDIKELEVAHHEEECVKQLRKLNNCGAEFMLVPTKVMIPIREGQWNGETYYIYANQAYSDVPDEVSHIGGKIALVETNLEYNRKQDAYVFYNSKAMHFDEVTEETNLVILAKQGIVVIEGIKIGG